MTTILFIAHQNRAFWWCRPLTKSRSEETIGGCLPGKRSICLNQQVGRTHNECLSTEQPQSTTHIDTVCHCSQTEPND